MAMPKRQPVKESALSGFKYFKKILPILDSLHGYATERDKAGNRMLHYDQYICLQLLFFFNPIVSSMRSIVQASGLKKVQKQLGVSPTSLGSFSEASRVFDADQLKPIIAELGQQLKPLKHDTKLDCLPGELLAIDGTELTALGKLTDHMFNSRDFKLHTHFDVLKGVPNDIDLTKAKDSEVEHLLERLLPDRVYVKDRGYACFKLLQSIHEIDSHFVCRIRDNSVYEVIEDNKLSKEDKDSGIISDQVVWLGSEGKKGEIKQPVRLLKIRSEEHTSELQSRGHL